jgi:hypothetical protein
MLALIPPCTATAQAAATVQPQEPHDAESRAALLRAMVVVKLAPYIKPEKAPADAPRTYRIAIVGNDGVTALAPRQLPGKKVDDTPVVIVPITSEAASDGSAAASYDMLYIASSIDDATVKQIVTSHATKPVPLVSERPGFANAGGSVQLFVKDNAIRFEVNAEALKKQTLRASPQLQKLSKKGPE